MMHVFDAETFEHLTLMGRTKDGQFVLGEGAAQRVLEHAKKLVAEERGPDYKTAFYQLLASITLADHLGDVAEDICHALEKVGDTEGRRAAEEGELFEQLQELLSERGITTIHGTKI